MILQYRQKLRVWCVRSNWKNHIQYELSAPYILTPSWKIPNDQHKYCYFHASKKMQIFNFTTFIYTQVVNYNKFKHH